MPKKSPLQLTPHWLAIRLSHMGDVVLTTGVLAYFGQQYGCRFDVLTRDMWAPLFTGHPFVDRVHSLAPKDLSFPATLRSFLALRKIYPSMGLLDLHGNLRSYMLSALWKGPILRYPKFRTERAAFLQKNDPAAQATLLKYSVAQRYAMAAEQEPPSRQKLAPCIWLTDEEKQWGKQTLARIFGEGNCPVAIHPFASTRYKTWPREAWKHFIKLCENKGLPWLVLGHGSLLYPDHPQDLTNKTSLRETCALLSACLCLVTGDSGPMHLASAVKTPVIALFGPTTEEWGFYPSGPYDMVIERPLRCRPCSLHGTEECAKGAVCLRDIAPEEVFEQLLRLLQQRT